MADLDNSDRPTLVFVHGAWADNSGFAETIREFRRRGYRTIGASNPLRHLTSDAAYVATPPAPDLRTSQPSPRGQRNERAPVQTRATSLKLFVWGRRSSSCAGGADHGCGSSYAAAVVRRMWFPDGSFTRWPSSSVCT